jgi:hypothetical protein
LHPFSALNLTTKELEFGTSLNLGLLMVLANVFYWCRGQDNKHKPIVFLVFFFSQFLHPSIPTFRHRRDDKESEEEDHKI